MIWNKNEIWIGLLVGLLLPFVGYAVLLMIYEFLENMGWASGAGFIDLSRPRTLALVAICLNIIPMNKFMSWQQGHSMRGVLIITMVYAVTWFFYFRTDIFS